MNNRDNDNGESVKTMCNIIFESYFILDCKIHVILSA